MLVEYSREKNEKKAMTWTSWAETRLGLDMKAWRSGRGGVNRDIWKPVEGRGNVEG